MLLTKKEINSQLLKQGVEPEQINELHLKLSLGQITYDSFIYSAKQLKAPSDSMFAFLDSVKESGLKNIGEEAIKKGELLVFWLNGGAATRYFDDSKITKAERKKFQKELSLISSFTRSLPKGITPVIHDITYLELKIINLLKITAELKLKDHPPVLIMNSFLTDKPTRDHLDQLFKKYPQLRRELFHFIVQRPKVPRFKKVKNLSETELFIDQKGHLSFAPAGHGDFLYLTRDYFNEEGITGVKYMFFNNIDNFGSTINPTILGYHIQQRKGRTVEVAPKTKGDKGGAPCLVDNKIEIVEQMKFPQNFAQSSLKYFNTNNFWFTLKSLLDYEEDLPLIIAEKKIAEGEVLQLEHFACDVNLPSNYLVVPRDERFWPAKRYVDLLIYLKDKKFKDLLKREYDL
ncbi:MAG: UTP--glucose-1-phosphate uridylyltransferase [Patescibacteria group bacterium]|jgi:hypothetical protein